MSHQVVTRGQVLPNGSLLLDPKVKLPVGPVEVLVRTLPVESTNLDKASNWFEYLLAARETLENQGVPLMSPDQAEAHIQELRKDRENSGQPRPVGQIMDELSNQAKANGLTEEILADLLKDE